MLDEKQEQAVRHTRGPCMVLAGPGSGKTTVITGRVLSLVKEAGVPEEELLVVTFTKAAAEEMRTRTLRLMGRNRSGVSFGTLHSFFYSVLRACSKTPLTVLSQTRQRELLRKLMTGEEKEEEREERIDQALRAFSRARSRREEPKEHLPLWKGYEEEKRKHGFIDFDDMAVRTHALFLENPGVLRSWQERFRYLMVDEFQDIDPLQYEILKLLAAPENNLFIVGDDDQSIYGFRGADPLVMQRFTKDYPDAPVILLDTNYRCQKRITEGSLKLIKNNTLRFPKEIRSLRHRGERITFSTFRDFRDEHEAVIREIRRALEAGDSCADHAVLFRTNNEPRILMERMMKENLPFRTKERVPNLFDHWICRDMFSYLELAEGAMERKHLLRIINRPVRFLERELFAEDPVSPYAVERRLAGRESALLAFQRLCRELAFLKGKGPYAAITYLRLAMGYDAFLKSYAADRGIPQEDLLDVLDGLQEAARGMESFAELKEHALRFSVRLKETAKHEDRAADAVLLSTLHGAKGLEFKTVFLIDAVSTLMPYKRAVTPEEIEEERRLFYVGVTRAKERLLIYDVKSLHRHPVSPSPFLKEMTDDR